MVSNPVEFTSLAAIISGPVGSDISRSDSTPTPQRHQPAHLNLRRSALGEEYSSLPTSSTSTQRLSIGLRSLISVTLPVPVIFMGVNEDSTIRLQEPRHSVMGPSVSVLAAAPRSGGEFSFTRSFYIDSARGRRSIFCECSVDDLRLPTPALAPTVGNRSLSDILYRAHVTLVRCVIDLERAPTAPRPVSSASNASSKFSTFISDEPIGAMRCSSSSPISKPNKDIDDWRIRPRETR